MGKPLVLAAHNLTRSYVNGAEKIDVLAGVDLTLHAGEALAIVGPSGSGKSTLLHVLGLLDAPTSGTLDIENQPVAALTDTARAALRRRTCGFVYQHHHLLREFTALENVLMPALIGGGRANSAQLARAEMLLNQVGLGHRLHHAPSQLSGGEQQRVAIARALMNEPKLLFADEPTGNLDPHTADAVADVLFGLIQTTGLAAILVTHNTGLAARCHRTLTMAAGRLMG